MNKIRIDTAYLETLCPECMEPIHANQKMVLIGKGQDYVIIVHAHCADKAEEWIYGLTEAE